MQNLSSFVKSHFGVGRSTFTLSILFAMLSVTVWPQGVQSQQVDQQAPAPPAMIFSAVPELHQGGTPANPEPSNPRVGAALGKTAVALIENGESGVGSVEDHTDATYDLLQDSVAGQGDFAFHLATHLGHWFKPTSSVVVTTGCKLFFKAASVGQPPTKRPQYRFLPTEALAGVQLFGPNLVPAIAERAGSR